MFTKATRILRKHWLSAPALFASMAAVFCVSAPSYAHGRPHQHGHVDLEVTVDGSKLTILLSSPLDNIVGFERAPRTDAERARVSAALEKLRASDSMFVLDSAAECSAATVDITSLALGLGKASTQTAAEGHADIYVRYEFTCRDAGRFASFDVNLFDGFKGVQRINVQAVSTSGQTKVALRRPDRRISLKR